MKKIIKKLQIVKIDSVIYRMDNYVEFDVLNFEYEIQKAKLEKKWSYYIQNPQTLIHRSYLYDKVFLLNSLNKKGPVIGDCYTNKEYRGKSIYPYVINRIAKEALDKGLKEVFVIVNQDNLSSIKGIEKAGFIKIASIKAKRWLWFYLKRVIIYYKQ